MKIEKGYKHLIRALARRLRNFLQHGNGCHRGEVRVYTTFDDSLIKVIRFRERRQLWNVCTLYKFVYVLFRDDDSFFFHIA